MAGAEADGLAAEPADAGREALPNAISTGHPVSPAQRLHNQGLLDFSSRDLKELGFGTLRPHCLMYFGC